MSGQKITCLYKTLIYYVSTYYVLLEMCLPVSIWVLIICRPFCVGSTAPLGIERPCAASPRQGAGLVVASHDKTQTQLHDHFMKTAHHVLSKCETCQTDSYLVTFLCKICCAALDHTGTVEERSWERVFKLAACYYMLTLVRSNTKVHIQKHKCTLSMHIAQCS